MLLVQKIMAPKMHKVVVGILLVLSATSTFAEYREAWVSPGELKNLEAEQKRTLGKTPAKTQEKASVASLSRRDQQGRVPGQRSSDPIAAFAHGDGRASLPRKSQATSPPPYKAKVVRRKVKADVGTGRRMKAVTRSMV
ncbi:MULTISPECIES: hypothetical protein [unclassified Burkholderia]|uniref:hypothetical protein n=1 Tax=unclassified Burkholderia TaxID=2613784 RepID=UPI000F584FAD|nr:MULTISPECIES: hypothetical protein [unclassified Burkholderia]